LGPDGRQAVRDIIAEFQKTDAGKNIALILSMLRKAMSKRVIKDD
jgi:hypothetical protein